jgi:hypothetical protein
MTLYTLSNLIHNYLISYSKINYYSLSKLGRRREMLGLIKSKGEGGEMCQEEVMD